MMKHRLWWTLVPDTPGDHLSLFEMIHDELARRAIGVPKETLRRMALIGTEHLSGFGGARIVLRGGSSSGKTFLAGLIAEVCDLPLLQIHAGLTAEQNWSGGADLSTTVEQLRGLIRGHPPAVAKLLATRAVVVLEAFDDSRLAGRYASASTQNYRQGKQNGFASLLKGDPMPGSGLGAAEWWSARQALVIVNGRFDGMGTRTASDDYADWGVIPELAAQLARAHTFFLEPPSGDALKSILHETSSSLNERFAGFGYGLRVPPETIAYIVRAVTAGGNDDSVLRARACLEQGAASLLLDALERRRAPGTTLALAPDHIERPQSARGIWRE